MGWSYAWFYNMGRGVVGRLVVDDGRHKLQWTNIHTNNQIFPNYMISIKKKSLFSCNKLFVQELFNLIKKESSSISH